MNGSELREIRRRIDPGLSNIKAVYGCYVNAIGEIVSTMEIPILDMDMEEREMYSTLLKNVISGPAGRHLLDVSFSTEQVEKSDEHSLLMGLRDKHLDDQGLRDALYGQIIDNFNNDGKSYVILLAADTYDICSKYNDGEEWSEDSEEQFEYFICSICQVKDSKAALRYQKQPKAFRGTSTGSILSNPIIGFMFPSFTDRAADIYTVPYYTKSTDRIHDELIAGLFKVENIPAVNATKKETFGRILYESLGSDCTLEVMKSLQANFADRTIADNEEGSVTAEVDITEIARVLKEKGIEESKIEEFIEEAECSIGDSISAHAITEKTAYRITSSEAEIITDPEQAVRLKTTVIDGITYFLVPAGSDVRVNGMPVSV